MVLPAYNEQECIEKSARDAHTFLAGRFDAFELILVDDGSKDSTPELIDALAKAHPGIVALHHPINRGYGAAIVSGFRRAGGELLFYTDADSQFDIREVATFVEEIERTGADAVFGFRVYRYDSVLRCVLSWTYNRLVRVLFGVRLRDVDCAFKLLRRDLFARMRIDSTDFFVDTEMVARAARLKAKIHEVGVRHYPRMAGRTTVRASHIPRTLLTVAKMWWRIRFGPQEPDATPAASLAPAQVPPRTP